jgi:hypothetical protein
MLRSQIAVGRPAHFLRGHGAKLVPQGLGAGPIIDNFPLAKPVGLIGHSFR